MVGPNKKLVLKFCKGCGRSEDLNQGLLVVMGEPRKTLMIISACFLSFFSREKDSLKS